MSDTNSAGFMDAIISALRSKSTPSQNKVLKPAMQQAALTDNTPIVPAVMGTTGGAQRAAQDMRHRQATIEQQLRDAGA